MPNICEIFRAILIFAVVCFWRDIPGLLLHLAVELQSAAPDRSELLLLQRRITFGSLSAIRLISGLSVTVAFENSASKMGQGRVSASFRDCIAGLRHLHRLKGIFGEVVCDGQFPGEELHLRLRSAKEEPRSIQGVRIEKGEDSLHLAFHGAV